MAFIFPAPALTRQRQQGYRAPDAFLLPGLIHSLVMRIYRLID